jgi:hypothetical protein
MRLVWAVVAAVGALAFVVGAIADPPGTWAIYLVNLLFWSGLAVTGPAVAAMMQLTEARWSPSVRQIAVTTVGFLPVGFVLFLVLIVGQAALYPWVTEPVPEKAAWLNPPFFWVRNVVMTAALFAAAFLLATALGRVPEAADERERGRRNRLSVVLLILWVLTLSLWGFDLVKTLDPVWYSGLFGGYWVVTTFYTGLALLSILVIRANATGRAAVPPGAVQDLAKLQFAMSVMWMYFFFSQYLVIWYGNVPHKTRFFVFRFFEQPWLGLAWAVMIVGWLIPFAYLLKRLSGRPPARHGGLFVVAVFALVAIFFERVLVVFPSISPAMALPFGLRDILITAGFAALFALSRRWFFARYQPVLDLPHPGVPPPVWGFPHPGDVRT